MSTVGTATIEIRPVLAADFSEMITTQVQKALDGAIDLGVYLTRRDLPSLRVRRYGWRYWVVQMPDVDGRWGQFAYGKSKKQAVRRMLAAIEGGDE